MHLLGRTKALHVYAHEGLKTIFELQQQVGEMYLNFPVIFHELPRNETVKIYDDTTLDVHAFPLDHRIPCCGFLFREKPRKANISREVIAEYQLQFSEIIALKNGSDVSRVDGTLLRAANLTIQAPARRSYAFCSDTRYSERVIQAVKDVDLLYHEATFAEDMAARAAQTHHSTAGQAASVAAKAGVDQLIIGHFSARYLSESVLLEEAQRYFQNVHLANEGAVFSPRSRPDLSLCE